MDLPVDDGEEMKRVYLFVYLDLLSLSLLD